ncbi:MAG: kelch repeat-containing protein [Owenweeksia sp.]|nr:kelch repeat-containing protein [Owenweeksia sp.]
MKRQAYTYFITTFLWVAVSQILSGQVIVALPDFPGPARDDAVAEVSGDFMFYGTGFSAGFSPLRDFWRYSFSDTNWEQLPDVPFSARQYCASAMVRDQLYLIGGWHDPQEYYDEVWRLDTRSMRWEQLSDFPGAPRWAASAVSHRGVIYFGMGRDNSARYQDWWAYHPEQNHWQPLPPLPAQGRNVALAEVVGAKIYLGLGEDSLGQALSDIWVFDIKQHLWEKLAMPNLPALKHPASAVRQGKIYLAGGESNDSLTANFRELNVLTGKLRDFGKVGYRQGRGGSMVQYGCELYLIGGLSVTQERLQEFFKIGWSAYQKITPERLIPFRLQVLCA